jgi:hypothetical protein
MKKKYADLLNLVRFINFSLPQEQNTDWSKGQKKLTKIGERLKPYIDDYNEKRDDIMLDNALEIDGKVQIKADGTFEYNKEGIKRRDKAIYNLFNSEFNYEVIQILNPDELEKYHFLNGWVSGVTFPEIITEEEIEL